MHSTNVVSISLGFFNLTIRLRCWDGTSFCVQFENQLDIVICQFSNCTQNDVTPQHLSLTVGLKKIQAFTSNV